LTKHADETVVALLPAGQGFPGSNRAKKMKTKTRFATRYLLVFPFAFPSVSHLKGEKHGFCWAAFWKTLKHDDDTVYSKQCFYKVSMQHCKLHTMTFAV
jgi:hypothetical protein